MEMGTRYVATPCAVCGAQGLWRFKKVVTFAHPRLRRSWWCDVCPPWIATFATFATFVGVTTLFNLLSLSLRGCLAFFTGCTYSAQCLFVLWWKYFATHTTSEGLLSHHTHECNNRTTIIMFSSIWREHLLFESCSRFCPYATDCQFWLP